MKYRPYWRRWHGSTTRASPDLPIGQWRSEDRGGIARSSRNATPRDGERPTEIIEQLIEGAEKVIALVNNSGLAFFTGTRYRGRSAMRLSASNWRLSPSDVEIVVAAVGNAIELARADQG